MNTFHAFWSFDERSFHLINYVLLIVLENNKLGIGNQGLSIDKTNQQLLGSFSLKTCNKVGSGHGQVGSSEPEHMHQRVASS
jgi:hypothetical protein